MFGANTASTCKLKMNLRQLRNFCQGTTSTATPTSTLANSFGNYLSETRTASATCADTAVSPGGQTPIPAQLMQVRVVGYLLHSVDKHVPTLPSSIMKLCSMNANIITLVETFLE